MKHLRYRKSKYYYYLGIRKSTVIIVAVIVALLLAGSLFIYLGFGQEAVIISPVSEESNPKSLITHDEWGYPKDIDGNWIENEDGYFGPLDSRRPHLEGEASWYSIDGCLGCNAGRIMANGEKLDDAKKTIACNDYPLGTRVLVENTKNNLFTEAVVTDTGGFGRYNRVADLSLATRDAIGCGGLCEVRVFRID